MSGIVPTFCGLTAEEIIELKQVNADRTAELEHVKRVANELAAQLVEVNNNRTGASPCARFCEALAAKKMFDNLQHDNRQLKAQVEQLVSDIHNAAIGYLTMGYSVDIESMAQCAYELTGINAEGCHTLDQHNDEIAVDRFGSAMKTKLKAARAKGRSGWDDKTSCSGEHLAQLLIEHLAKGNAGTFEDIANFSMMLHQRGEDPQLLRTALILRDAEIKAQAVIDALNHILSTSQTTHQSFFRNDRYMYVSNRALDEYANQLRQQAKAGV